MPLLSPVNVLLVIWLELFVIVIPAGVEATRSRPVASTTLPSTTTPAMVLCPVFCPIDMAREVMPVYTLSEIDAAVIG